MSFRLQPSTALRYSLCSHFLLGSLSLNTTQEYAGASPAYVLTSAVYRTAGQGGCPPLQPRVTTKERDYTCNLRRYLLRDKSGARGEERKKGCMREPRDTRIKDKALDIHGRSQAITRKYARKSPDKDQARLWFLFGWFSGIEKGRRALSVCH